MKIRKQFNHPSGIGIHNFSVCKNLFVFSNNHFGLSTCPIVTVLWDSISPSKFFHATLKLSDVIDMNNEFEHAYFNLNPKKFSVKCVRIVINRFLILFLNRSICDGSDLDINHLLFSIYRWTVVLKFTIQLLYLLQLCMIISWVQL